MQQNLLKIGNIERIHLVNPSKDEVEKLVKKYHFHEIIEEDLIELNTQDKLDIYDDYVFLVIHFPKYDPITERYLLNEFDFILGKDFIITASRFPSNHIYKIRQEYQKDLEETGNQEDKEFKITPYYILYKILDAMYDKTLNILSKFSKDVYFIEEEIFGSKLNEKVLEKLMIKKRNAIFLKHIYKPQVEIIGDLSSEIKSFYKRFQEEVDIYFEDIEYKLDKIINQIDILFENIDSLTEIYNSLMSIKINKIMTLLTVFTVIIGIHTLVAGLYGMNVKLPLGDLSYAFWLIVGFNLILTILLLLFFKYKRRF